jgi:hypothetical protein
MRRYGLKERKLLIFLVDAFAYEYLKEIDFLPTISVEKCPLETLLGYSSTIMPAIWSGKYPEETGIWTEFYHSPRKPYRLMKLLSWMPNKQVKNLVKTGIFEIAQTCGALRETLPGIPESIEYLFRRNDIRYWDFPPTKMECETFDKILKQSNVPYHFEFHKHKISKYEILKRLQRLSKFNQVFIYYIATIDALGHTYGPSPNEFKEQIENLNDLILEAFKILTRNYDADMVVFSDHGMTKISRRCNIFAGLESYKLGTDYLAFIDSTIARFWFTNEAIKNQIIDDLKQIKYGHLLTEEEKKKNHINFPDKRYGEGIFVADPGVQFFPNFLEPKKPVLGTLNKGMHGYLPEDPSTRGIFIYSGNAELELKDNIHVVEVLEKFKYLLNLKNKCE